jgi:membrane protease subunit (stomatin/prohibitin family)
VAIIDLVRWSPHDGQNIYAFRFPEINLSTYTQLIVQESQEAVLFSKGRIIGKFGPGKHTLDTENIPILRNLFGIPFGGKNPFTAEVWFVNKLQPYNIDWSIDRMDIHDADYNTGIPLVASGRYGLKILDAEKFLIKIVGTKTSFNQEDLTDQFFGEFSTKTKSTVLKFMMSNKIGLKQISAYLDSISEHLKSIMLPFWENLGLELTKFYITSIGVDSSTDEGKRILDAISRNSAQSIGGYTWQQEQVFGVANNALEGLSDSSGLLNVLTATSMMDSLGSSLEVMKPHQIVPPTYSGNEKTINNDFLNKKSETHCSNCSKKFNTANNYCPHCGDSYRPCPSCMTDNDANARRCISCGTNLVHERREFSAEDSCKRCQITFTSPVKYCPNCGLKQ